MGRTHIIKIAPEYFPDVEDGRKHFEIRKNDRDYQVGDLVYLVEIKDGDLTGNTVKVQISYVLKNCQQYGLMDGYCIFCW